MGGEGSPELTSTSGNSEHILYRSGECTFSSVALSLTPAQLFGPHHIKTERDGQGGWGLSCHRAVLKTAHEHLMPRKWPWVLSSDELEGREFEVGTSGVESRRACVAHRLLRGCQSQQPT